MDRLVTVDVKELHLPLKKGAAPSAVSTGNSRRGSSSSGAAAFTVTNLMHTMSVAMHLTTTKPAAFSIQPSPLSILSPLSSSTFFLSASASASITSVFSSSPDSLFVRSVLLPTGKGDAAALLRLFSKPGVHVFKDACLPIYLVGADAAAALIDKSSLGKALDTALRSAELFSRAICACSVPVLGNLLVKAASSGNAQFVSALLEAGADANAQDSGRSALFAAVESASLEAVTTLLESGAVVVASDEKRHPMHEAAAGGQVEIMKGLVAGTKGEEPWGDITDAAGRTPLHFAAMNDHLDAARFCVSSGGSDADRADDDGWTPLHYAASRGQLGLVEFLLDSSCYSKHALTRSERATPFDLAVEAGHAHLFDALRLGDALCRAARAGDAEAARSCMARGADAGRRDQHGWTPLHRAAFKGHAEVVEALLEGGARMDDVDDAGYTPLRLAVEAGHAEVALLLLARGASRVGLKGVKDKGAVERLHRLKLDPRDAETKKGDHPGRAASGGNKVAATAVLQLL